VTELKGQAAVRAEKTIASLVADLDDAIAFARLCNNPSAMVAAITPRPALTERGKRRAAEKRLNSRAVQIRVSHAVEMGDIDEAAPLPKMGVIDLD
jgi:hypothetical protein